MGLFQKSRSRHLHGGFVHLHGMTAADKAEIRAKQGIAARQAIAFRDDVDERVDDDGFALDLSPDGRRRLHELFLKIRHVRIPENLQRQLRAQSDALGAPDAQGEIIDGIVGLCDAGRPGWADCGAEPAAAAFFPLKNGMVIGMHPLFLGAGSKSHGDIFDGAAKQRNHVPLEMGKNHEAFCLLEDGSDLNGFKVSVSGGKRDDISSIRAVGDDDRTSEKVRRVAVIRGGFQGIRGVSSPAGVENRGVENKRFDFPRAKPDDDFPCVVGRQVAFISPLAPVKLDSDAIACFERRREPGQQFPQRSDVRFFSAGHGFKKYFRHDQGLCSSQAMPA